MPGRGNPGRGQAGGPGRAGKHDGGVDMLPDDPGKSGASPGHRKRDGGAASARDFAPGQGGEPPGQLARDRGEHAVETPEPDSFDREG